MTPKQRSQAIKSLAHAIGFDRVGITAAKPHAATQHYKTWLALGYAGTMSYLERNVELRSDPRGLLDQAQSMICVALNYHRSDPQLPPDPNRPTGKVAQYARGRDYHVVMRQMLETLAADMHDKLKMTFDYRPCVDTAPLLERELAREAGIGWVGKNTLVLHDTLGSYFFLGELITTLELEPDSPIPDRCGTCTRCLDACPTGAFPQPGVLDARRCISYLTIEHRGEIEPELQAKMGDWVFGCDICQQVCPFNRKAPPASNEELTDDLVAAELDLAELIELRSGEYRRLTAGSAARRATRPMWQRNAKIAFANQQQEKTR
jgi:epoxyqueuosine reductase